jgi:hypothetical protein
MRHPYLASPHQQKEWQKMPIEEFGGKNNYKITPPLPQHLEHQPIYAMPYQPFDGMYRKNTDARYLSVGLSQWGHEDLSLKIMRYRDQWSRQSEEIPLHRVIDSTVFLAKVLLDRDQQSVEIERNLFVDQPEGFRVREESVAATDIQKFEAFLETHNDELKERFNKLFQLLSSLKTQGKL